MSALQTVSSLIYLVSAVCYVLGVHLMRSPKTARKGNGLSAVGMFLAVITIIVNVIIEKRITPTGWIVLILGLALEIYSMRGYACTIFTVSSSRPLRGGSTKMEFRQAGN